MDCLPLAAGRTQATGYPLPEPGYLRLGGRSRGDVGRDHTQWHSKRRNRVVRKRKETLASRLVSVKKAGYYPTPAEVTALIIGHLQTPEDDYRWLDPCCGEGIALESLALALGRQTYGIELDVERAQEARGKLDYVRQGDYAAHRLPKGLPPN